jgi:hypothetical protein
MLTCDSKEAFWGWNTSKSIWTTSITICPQLDAHTPFVASYNTTTLLFEYRRWLAVQACSRWILCKQNPTSSENNVSPTVRLVLKMTCHTRVLFCVELLFIVHAKKVVLGFVFTIEQWWKCFGCPSTQWCPHFLCLPSIHQMAQMCIWCIKFDPSIVLRYCFMDNLKACHLHAKFHLLLYLNGNLTRQYSSSLQCSWWSPQYSMMFNSKMQSVCSLP